jgi:hypothetical protein
MAWFYEIRSSNNAVLKRDGGFATQDAATTAGRADAKKMKNSRQPVGRILNLRGEAVNMQWTAQYLRTIGTLLYFVIRFAHGEDSEGDHLESGSVA